MSWTEERVDLLKKLWGEGLSASQIAGKLGEVTRNAVIGKVHRLGLAGRATTSRMRPARPRNNIAIFPPRAPQVQFRTFGNTALKPAFVPVEERRPAVIMPLHRPLPELDAPPAERVSLLELKECMCRWPVGDPMEEGFHFCGRKKSTGASYCEHHAAIAYNPVARRRRAN
jgi:GcrA cell cycle regulator